MSRATSRKELSLKALELFQICAREGSLQAAARETGLTISTVSQHLGVALLDHSRRSMMPTPKGRAFLRNIDDALHIIRNRLSRPAPFVRRPVMSADHPLAPHDKVKTARGVVAKEHALFRNSTNSVVKKSNTKPKPSH